MADTTLILKTLVEGTAEARKGLDSVTKGVEGIGDSTKKIDTLGDTLQKNAAKFAILATAAGIAFYKITSSADNAIEAAVNQQNALLGLNSIVRGTGNDFQKAQDFIQTFTQDGLVGIGDASTSLKNLLSRGFGLNESIEIMNRFKDSSAFGRQASLDMGTAIRGATEGLKNENSILVDNAGVTKNVSQMWKDYADKIGVGVGSLTLAQKREAELQGIMEETKHQVGDAAKMSDSYAGAQARSEAATRQLQVAVGTSLQPAMEAFYKAVTPVVIALTNFAKENPQIISGIIIMAGALTGLITAISGIGFIFPAFQAGWALLSVAWTYISTVAIPALMAAIGAISTPVLVIIGVIAALIAAGVALYTHWDTVKAKSIEIFGAIGNFITSTWTAISEKTSEIWGSITTFFSGVWDGITNIFKFGVALATGILITAFDAMGIDIIAVFKNLYDGFVLFWDMTKLAFDIGLIAVKTAWETVWGGIKDFFAGVWKSLTSNLSIAWANIKALVNEGLTAVSSLFNTMADPIKKAWGALWEGLGSAVGVAWESVKNIIKESLNWIVDRVNYIIRAINSLASKGGKALGLSVPTISEIPRLAEGGIVKARPGGIIANIGEGGQDEAVIPLNKMKGMGGFGGGVTITFTGVFGKDAAQEISDLIVKDLARAGAI